MSIPRIPTLESLEVNGKTVLVRTDLNVPMQGGRITDDTRIIRLLPTLNELAARGAKVVVLSHFDRPNGKFVPSMSLAPLVDALSGALKQEVHFGVDCIGPAARDAIGKIKPGEIVLLENLRFHAEEEANDPHFSAELASLGNAYVNDAFSCSHRAHASIVGVAQHLPFAAGRLLEQEVTTLQTVFDAPSRPITAIIGGSKVSTKLELLHNLILTMDKVMIGGAMANTFLLAQGHDVGKSICEKSMKKTALAILKDAQKKGCEIILPVDLVVTRHFEAQAACKIVSVGAIPEDHTATDIGPESVSLFAQVLQKTATVVWNGPVGAFETSPFDTSTTTLARHIAALTLTGKIKSIAGGGDTVSAINHAGLSEEFTYISTAGGAFLEWLEGKALPGVAALLGASESKQAARA